MENGLRLRCEAIYNSSMKIEHQKVASCPEYSEQVPEAQKSSAKLLLASALGIAAGFSLSACNDTVVGGEGVAVSAESSSSDDDALAGGIAYPESSSSQITGGASSYQSPSSSSADTVQIIEAGVVAIYESSSSWSLSSSSSQTGDIGFEVVEPPLSGDIVYYRDDLSSIAEVYSSSSSQEVIEPIEPEPRLSGSIVYDMESNSGSSSSASDKP